MIQRALLIAVAAALPLQAAVTYRVEVEWAATRQSVDRSRVTVDGKKIRIDFEPDGDATITGNALISTDGGKSYIGINSRLKTWWPANMQEPWAQPFTPRPDRGGHGERARKVQWTWREEPEGEAGKHNYSGDLSFVALQDVMDGQTVDSRNTAKVEIATDEGIDATWLGFLPFITGIDDINSRLAASGGAIKGFPTRITLTSTRQYNHGPLLTAKHAMTVSDVKTLTSVDPHLFERPKDYREQAPVMAAPVF
ncbi:MAG TPA: hypothetical protein VJ276_11875 [Thermoanaerobaculia bacterium]|nr:hypothetical protein [Thermoanaerobaculia bacterium]